MAHGNPVSGIIVSAEPRGVFLEGVAGDTSKPGTKMIIKYNTAFVGGRPTWVSYGTGSSQQAAADNDPRGCFIMIEDSLNGYGPTQAPVVGQRIRLYAPLPGEEMNILVEGEAGTASANAFFIGTRFGVRAATGLYYPLAVTGVSSTAADFVCQEHIDETPNVATLVWAMKQ